MSDDTTVNVKGLDKLIKALGKKPPTARVGILGASNARGTNNGEGGSNATIGAGHEFGTSKLPIRSFLRIPISENLGRYLEKSGLLDKETLKQVIASGELIPWLQKVAIVAERVVADGFATGGFGKWQPSNMAHKKVHQTLVETQQLRESITSEVKA